MDILYLLIPLSSVLVLGILGVFAWALHGGQFDDLEQHGEQILDIDADALDRHQGPQALRIEKSVRRP
ncbi:MAG TPA: cbb3-type cytochrome oxidase assembly protein CcoS [Albitalea sp.]|uniref:cbb3-type cytochrome oxidase assembly protein CcoS n=1 Tax=Piscinibacter sp. TaxID=1903157 RepID=UPI002ED210A2